jgi:hypothetical protein
MPTRLGQQQAQQASSTYSGQAQTANTDAQADLTQANQDQANLRSGKMVGADPYLNPQYLAAVNQLRSGALDQNNNAADAQLRANNARTGGMNSTATTGAIAKLAGDKMRLGNQLGAEQTAGDWSKNVGYQLNLAQQPLESAKVQGGLYNTATTGLNDANKTLSQFGLASYGPWMSALSALGGAGAMALKGGMPGAAQLPADYDPATG